MSAPSKKIKFLFMVPVWGGEYTNLFVNVCLPLILTNGNLGHFHGRDDVHFIVQTTYADMMTIEKSPAWKKLIGIMQADFFIIDGLVDLSATHITMSDCFRLTMRSDLVSPGFTRFVFLTPDSFWTDGTFRRMDELTDQGFNAIMASGLRTNLETLRPYLESQIKKSPDNPVIPNRVIVSKAVSALHRMAKAQVWTSGAFINSWPSQIFWFTGNDSLINHSFHMHPLCFRSQKRRTNFSTTVDGDYISKSGFPLSSIYVVTDSDDIAGIELSPESRDWGQKLENANLKMLQRFSVIHADRYHWHFFSKQVTFTGEAPMAYLPYVLRNANYVTKEVLSKQHLAQAYQFLPEQLVKLCFISFRIIRKIGIKLRSFIARRIRQRNN